MSGIKEEEIQKILGAGLTSERAIVPTGRGNGERKEARGGPVGERDTRALRTTG